MVAGGRIGVRIPSTKNERVNKLIHPSKPKILNNKPITVQREDGTVVPPVIGERLGSKTLRQKGLKLKRNMLDEKRPLDLLAQV